MVILLFGAAVVDAADLAVLTTSITDNLEVLIPVGISIMAVMIGVALIPKVIRRIGRV